MTHPFADLVGLVIDAQGSGTSAISLLADERHMNPHGAVHGAVICALADTGMGAALYPCLTAGQICATIDIAISYFKPIGPGRLVCRTEVVNQGKTVAHLCSQVFAGGDRIASASGNYAIFTPRATNRLATT